MYRPQHPRPDAPAERQAYRLTGWPDVPERLLSARVLQALSRMTLGPVTDRWFLLQTGLGPIEAADLLAGIAAQGVLETIRLGPAGPARVESKAPAKERPRRWHWRLQRAGLKEAAIVALLCLAAGTPDGGAAPQLSTELGPLAAPELPASRG